MRCPHLYAVRCAATVANTNTPITASRGAASAGANAAGMWVSYLSLTHAPAARMKHALTLTILIFVSFAGV
jgi:hypothetical protein